MARRIQDPLLAVDMSLAEKERTMLGVMRQRIVDGVYLPGQRLPTRQALMQAMGLSITTVQRAMEGLEREGFIESRGAAGSYVAAHPPHLSRFAILLLGHPVAAEAPVGTHWSQFNWAVKTAAEAIEQAQPLTHPHVSFSYHYGIFPGWTGDSPGYQRLLAELHEHRLAGLIFSLPHLAVGRFHSLQAPAVLISPESTGSVPAVFPDLDAWQRRAVGHLASRGRRRLALIASTAQTAHLQHQFDPGLGQEHGLTMRDTWVRHATPENVVDCAREIFSVPPDERPDGLLIDDDHLVAGASVGLLLAGVRVPEEVEIVAHANFPLPLRAFVPAIYLGFDAREIVDTCVRQIQAQRRNEPVAAVTAVAPRFEAELQGCTSARSDLSPNRPPRIRV